MNIYHLPKGIDSFALLFLVAFYSSPLSQPKLSPACNVVINSMLKANNLNFWCGCLVYWNPAERACQTTEPFTFSTVKEYVTTTARRIPL